MSGDGGLAEARALLFVPGARADRFDRAAAAVAAAAGRRAMVVVDLEDAVAPGEKEAARDAVDGWLGRGNRAVVRINGAGTPWFADDLALVVGRGCPVMLPKAADPAVPEEIVRRTGGRSAVLALVETAEGVEGASALARAAGVARLAFGNVDLSTELGVDAADAEALRYARSRVVLASAAAGRPGPVDGVTTDLGDEAALRADAREGRRLGFTAKLCLHPRQLGPVVEEFGPAERELEWARRVLAAAPTGTELTVVDGKMVDRPVWERARRLIASVD
jgi:citrate lyase subunit beta/citryl-CoA lyase